MEPDGAGRKLAAIMFTDIVGYTALMAESEAKGHRVRERQGQVLRPLVEQYGGDAGHLGFRLGIEATAGALAVAGVAFTALGAALWPGDDPAVVEHTHSAVLHTHLHAHDAHHQHEHASRGGPEPHRHPHAHDSTRHRHVFVIDDHHPRWPQRQWRPRRRGSNRHSLRRRH